MVRHHYKLAAFVLVTAMLLIVAVAYGMFRGTFTSTVPVTVTAARAGLVMDPGAKVKMRGVEVGRVSAVDLSGSQAVITLQLQPDLLTLIPANSGVEIESTTVFGAKFVSFIPPEKPSAVPIAQGANVTSQNVTVEFNTVFRTCPPCCRPCSRKSSTQRWAPLRPRCTDAETSSARPSRRPTMC